MQHFQDLIKRFRSDERGVFMVLFAVLAIVLIATSGAVVDFTVVQQARTRAQTALDAATLALQKDMSTLTDTEIKNKATTILQERIGDSSIESIVDSAVKDVDNGRLTLTAHVTVPTYFVRLVGFQTLRANLQTEVTRASSNLEIAVALDITYSMNGSRISALKTATKNLIDDLIQTEQEPTYSKMALAPYSNSVNPGTYRDTVRGGAPTAAKAISSVTWNSNSTLRNLVIEAITRSPNNSTATKISLSTKQDTLLAGQTIWINGSASWSTATWTLNGAYIVGTKTTVNNKTVFELMNLDGTKHNSTGSSYNTAYSGTAGRVTLCDTAKCELTANVNAHGMTTGWDMFIFSSGGSNYNTSGSYKLANSSWVDNSMTTWTVGATTTNSFVITGTDPRDISGTNLTATGGTAQCAVNGCLYQRYINADGNARVYKATDCAVERATTTNAFTDTMATTTPLNIQYGDDTTTSGSWTPQYATGVFTNYACSSATIVPLTPVKKDLKDAVDALAVSGSTAGHTGLAWAWYLISPNFIDGSLKTAWPVISVPHAYKEKDLVKAIILMTDGQFNTMYDKGLPSKDSHDPYSGTTAVRTNTNALLGTSSAQALSLCTEIKKAIYGIELYTVGFMINTNSADDVAARTLLTSCAPDSEHDFFPNSASDLDDAFDKIGKNLSELRISK